ncbi:hypothetical protein KBC79_03500 [Candidatus Woesebacteria bacterium]|nr:hypothetical protein [Candidatus Woesebacteria bacterium]
MTLRAFRKHQANVSTANEPASRSWETWWDQVSWWIKAIALSITLVVCAAAVLASMVWELPLQTPLGQFSTFQFLPEKNFDSTGKVVYGFLPYWNLNKVSIQKELTHMGYFSLTIAGDGSLITRESNGNEEPGFNKLKSDQLLELSNQLESQGGSVELVLSQFYADDITNFLLSDKSQETFLNSLDSILLAYPFAGVNIDIELAGSASPQLRNELTDFMAKLRQHLDKKYSKIQLSIDVYASAAKNSQLWDIPALAPHVDYFIIMAYDFHRRTSPQAGPVAPLFGGRELWDSDINQHLQEFVKQVPSSKLLLGIPFYGYEWQTTSRDSQSHTFPDTGSTASFERVQKLLQQKEELKVEEHWNEEALSPYLSYIEDGLIYVTYYENSRSLSYKLDYVNQLDLGGIAIWALGYEANSRELWDVVGRKL